MFTFLTLEISHNQGQCQTFKNIVVDVGLGIVLKQGWCSGHVHIMSTHITIFSYCPLPCHRWKLILILWKKRDDQASGVYEHLLILSIQAWQMEFNHIWISLLNSLMHFQCGYWKIDLVYTWYRCSTTHTECRCSTMQTECRCSTTHTECRCNIIYIIYIYLYSA